MKFEGIWSESNTKVSLSTSSQNFEFEIWHTMKRKEIVLT